MSGTISSRYLSGSGMTRLLALVTKELRVLARDRQGLAVLFLMPAVFILIMSLAMRDSFNERAALAVDFVYLDLDGGKEARSLGEKLDTLVSFRRVSPEQVKDEKALRELVRHETYKFALLVPKGFGATLGGGLGLGDEDEEETPPSLKLFFAPSVVPQAKSLFQARVGEMLQRLRAETMLAALSEEAEPGQLQALLDPSGVRIEEVFLYRGQAPERLPSAVQQNVPAWLVFAMFFVVIPLSTAFIVERQQGSLLRLRVMDISAFALIAGKIPAYYAINMMQMLVMLAVGAYLVPALGGDRLDLGTSPLGLFLIGSATSLAAIGFALVIATLARTSVQATTFGGVANLVLGAIGGIMVPKMVMSSSLREAAEFSPMSWGLEGFWDILLRQGGWRDVLPEVGMLTGFAVVCFLLAVAVFRRRG